MLAIIDRLRLVLVAASSFVVLAATRPPQPDTALGCWIIAVGPWTGSQVASYRIPRTRYPALLRLWAEPLDSMNRPAHPLQRVTTPLPGELAVNFWTPDGPDSLMIMRTRTDGSELYTIRAKWHGDSLGGRASVWSETVTGRRPRAFVRGRRVSCEGGEKALAVHFELLAWSLTAAQDTGSARRDPSDD